LVRGGALLAGETERYKFNTVGRFPSSSSLRGEDRDERWSLP